MNLLTSVYLGQSRRGNALTDVTLSFLGAPRLAAVPSPSDFALTAHRHEREQRPRFHAGAEGH
jgi:hypothetical protein